MIVRFLNFVSDTADKLAVRFGQEPEHNERTKKDTPDYNHDSQKLKDAKKQKKNAERKEAEAKRSIADIIKDSQDISYTD